MNNQVFTSYFASKSDPQRDFTHERNDFELIQGWYKSLHNVELNGVIFHDHLWKGFCRRYFSNLVSFQKTEIGERSLNDERFFSYRDFLLNHEEIDQVLLTDLFDIKFFKDPFRLFDPSHKIYIGDETRSIGGNSWMLEQMELIKPHLKNFSIPDNFARKKTLNAGIVGGKRETILGVVMEMINLFREIPEKINANMPVMNLVVRSRFSDDKIMHGKPLNSSYKKYEKKGDFFIKHK